MKKSKDEDASTVEVGGLRKYLRDAGVSASVANDLVKQRNRGENILAIDEFLRARKPKDKDKDKGKVK